MSIGAIFEDTKAIQKIEPTCASVFIKLIAVPAVFLPLAVLLSIRGQSLVALAILLGAPSMVSGYVMSTALSAVTLTMLLWILRSLTLISRPAAAKEVSAIAHLFSRTA